MRGDPTRQEMKAAASLGEALALLAAEPGAWTPIAGGTEVMVAHAAGRLAPQRFLSLWSLPELKWIRAEDAVLSIGGGITFAEIRRHATIAAEFPLLAQAAGWIGSIANQNRATLAGNIVNGSPAADGPPALLVYDAEIELISERGSRRMPYADFHLGYKRNRMAADELVLALHLPRRFSQYLSYQRKVGTRNAMAITKVGLAATARVEDGAVAEIRLAAASLADRPLRLRATEAALLGQPLSAETRLAARRALLSEAKPIDDIRSTALYRAGVAANLLDAFLDMLAGATGKLSQGANGANPTADPATGNPVLDAFNAALPEEARRALLSCCAARRWAEAMLQARPFAREEALYKAADQLWSTMWEPDWLEAFAAHPRIGERKPAQATEQSKAWSSEEQAQVHAAEAAVLAELAEGNRSYERKFGLTYIVCATGKSAEEMLAILKRRLANGREAELHEAAEQQRQITQIRLRKWLEA